MERAPPPCGAFWQRDRCLLRVWAPQSQRVHAQLEGGAPRSLPLEPDVDGYFTLATAEIRPGDRYRLQLDDGPPLPDPYSRFQPDGPHGASQLIDHRAYRWNDAGWGGLRLIGQVFYELHVGAFTPEGTLAAARARLPWLREMGITAIELMPLAECAGRWNWGYDGVCLYAPSHHYGPPEALKAFVDAAHGLGLGVVLDVVYNHLGPDGNYLAQFSPQYFSERHHTDWGAGLNFDGERSAALREYVIGNACAWVEHYHIDGLRLDATQDIRDDSARHVLAELVQRVRDVAAPREVLLIAEDESQQASRLLAREAGGHGLDAMWNDDFHHAAHVAATGRREAYYHDYAGTPQELVAAARRGFLYQGQYYAWQRKNRGQRHRAAPMSAVHYLENHDQVANGVWGRRIHQLTSPGRCRALTALLLLGPQTPLLFMGQEFQASQPFLYFTDHAAPLGEQVRQGRNEFLAQFPGAATAAARDCIADPNDAATFRRCQLDWAQARDHTEAVSLHRDLLRLRREDALLSQQAAPTAAGVPTFDGAVLGPSAFVLRWSGGAAGERLLLVNLGAEVPPQSYAEPLLACAPGERWQLLWSSERVAYGGAGEVDPLSETGWRLPAECATLHACAAEDAARPAAAARGE
jgi:maltooligosyltrehalose trehalohydrolase